jgi:uncharacterized protein (TIGR02271 family)
MVSPRSTPPDDNRCNTPAATDPHGEELIIPQIEEFASVAKQLVETGVVRISKHVDHVEKVFHPTLAHDEVSVERVPVHRIVKEAPVVRIEGDTTIVPVVEEVMVKLLLVKEEIRITRLKVEEPSPGVHVTLRREEVVVDRDSPAPPANLPNTQT